MSRPEQGLYYTPDEESFQKVYPSVSTPKITFEKPGGRSVEEWFDDSRKRQSLRAESNETYDFAKIELESDRPICIGITGDWHLGAEIDNELLETDINLIAEHPLVTGAFFMGDLTDSANFNPAQDEDYYSYEEQRAMMTSILDYIGKDRVLAMWRGNHDHKWESKNGTSKYTGLSKKYDCPVFYGSSYIGLHLNDLHYNLMGSHRLRGNSIYTNAHPSVRGHKEVQNLDLTFAGHIHKRGVVQQPIKQFNGSRMTHGVITGTYERGSGYGRDSGFGNQRNEELGMYWAIFGHDKKYIQIMGTQEMVEFMGRYL